MRDFTVNSKKQNISHISFLVGCVCVTTDKYANWEQGLLGETGRVSLVVTWFSESTRVPPISIIIVHFSVPRSQMKRSERRNRSDNIPQQPIARQN